MSGAAAFLLGLVLGAACAAAAGFFLWRSAVARLGRLLSFAGHEINTPLTAVNMTALNFLSGIFGDLPEDQVKWMQLLRSQSSRMGSIVGELRDLVHHHMRHDLVVYVEKTSVNEAADAVVKAVGSSVSETEAQVKVEMPELPQVMADPDRLFRTISSMLFHARKFRAAGDIRLTGEFREAAGDVAAVVEYRGAVIPPEETARSLELFYPAERRKDQLLCSVGMGLGMLRIIARLQGGDFDFTVAPDGLSRLILRLPTTLRPPARPAR